MLLLLLIFRHMVAALLLLAASTTTRPALLALLLLLLLLRLLLGAPGLPAPLVGRGVDLEPKHTRHKALCWLGRPEGGVRQQEEVGEGGAKVRTCSKNGGRQGLCVKSNPTCAAALAGMASSTWQASQAKRPHSRLAAL